MGIYSEEYDDISMWYVYEQTKDTMQVYVYNKCTIFFVKRK